MAFSLSPTVDWLSVSYPPDKAPMSDLRDLLVDMRADAFPEGLWRVLDHGTIRLTQNTQWSGLQASGAFLAYLRGHARYLDFLTILASCCDPLPRVTRLDVCVDLPIHGSDVVPKLFQDYPHTFRFRNTRNTVPTSYYSGHDLNPMGLHGGTLYLGRVKSRSLVIGKIYDKGIEQSCVRGASYEPWTRYEWTFRHGYASLKDAASPDAIFWHHTPAAILTPPGIAEIWVQGVDDMSWNTKRVDRLPADILKRVIENSHTLKHWLALADQMGPYGRSYLLSLIARTASGSEAAVGPYADPVADPPSKPLSH